MHGILIALLIAILAAAIVSIAVMGLCRRRRTKALARKAGEMGMRFSADDPFDVPRRYGNFTVISSGHSPCASNVTYGRLNRRVVRAFDFRYELGHGTRRTTRHYGVIVLETEIHLPEVLMWNERDAESIPLCAIQPDGRIGCWSYCGSEELASVLLVTAGPLAADAAGMQISRMVLMVHVPAGAGGKDYTSYLDSVAAMVEMLCETFAGRKTDRVERAVENEAQS